MCEQCELYVAEEMIEAGVEQAERRDNISEPVRLVVARIYAAMVFKQREIHSAMEESQALRLADRLN